MLKWKHLMFVPDHSGIQTNTSAFKNIQCIEKEMIWEILCQPCVKMGLHEAESCGMTWYWVQL